MIRFTCLSIFSILLSSALGQQQMLLVPASVQPDQIDSLYYWFSADQEVFDSVGTSIEDGEQVGRWNDLSGNGHHLINTGNGPTYEASGGPGAGPCIRFYEDTIGSNIHYWESDEVTVFTVMKFDSPTRDAEENYILRFNAATDTRQWYCGSTGAAFSYTNSMYIFKNGGTVDFVRKLGGTKNSTYKINCWRNQLFASSLRQNASDITLSITFIAGGDRSIKDGDATLRLGNAFIHGRIVEIIVYSRYLIAAEVKAIENYLNTKYNLY